MKENKILTYINFARKAGVVVYGIDNIKATKKDIFCVIIDSTAKENLLSSAKTYCKKHGLELITLNCKLDDILKTNNCKILGICNQDLANQILINNKE